MLKGSNQIEFEQLYEKNQNGLSQMTIDVMKTTLLGLLKKCLQVTYIVLDAMDECQKQRQVVELIHELLDLDNVYIFVTCRHPASDFSERAVRRLQEISLDREKETADIVKHIDKALNQCQGCFKGLEGEIKEALLKGADGQ